MDVGTGTGSGVAVHDAGRQWRVDASTTSASSVKNELTDVLRDGGVSTRAIVDATHVMYELVMNGVEHGTADDDGCILVSWSTSSDVLCLTVTDSGTGAQEEIVALPPSIDRARGRGLAMTEAFSDGWDVDRSSGTVVRAWFDLQQRA